VFDSLGCKNWEALWKHKKELGFLYNFYIRFPPSWSLPEQLFSLLTQQHCRCPVHFSSFPKAKIYLLKSLFHFWDFWRKKLAMTKIIGRVNVKKIKPRLPWFCKDFRNNSQKWVKFLLKSRYRLRRCGIDAHLIFEHIFVITLYRTYSWYHSYLPYSDLYWISIQYSNSY
jgi:hypothetical protein